MRRFGHRKMSKLSVPGLWPGACEPRYSRAMTWGNPCASRPRICAARVSTAQQLERIVWLSVTQQCV